MDFYNIHDRTTKQWQLFSMIMNSGNYSIESDDSYLESNFYISRRKMERFDLELTTYLSMVDKREKKKSFEFMTSNICAGGAFFKTNEPLSVGANVKLAIILPLGKFKNVKHQASHIDISGSVIRTDYQGMAICFDKHCRISPLV